MINMPNLLFMTGDVEAVFYSWIGTKGFDEKKENEDLGTVHTYPDIFESATFSFRIRNSQANPEIFESALHSGNFWIR